MFQEKLLDTINKNITNNFTDNFDFARFGKTEKDIIDTTKSLEKITPYFPKILSFYNLLEDERSKELLIKLVAFRILGHRKIKLPLSMPAYEKACKLVDSILDKEKYIYPGFLGWKLYFGDLSKINIPFSIYTLSEDVVVTFLLKQYEYRINENEYIRVEPGDTVIDAGGCWGDTALYFSNEAGSNGKVFTFEFIPKNLEIFHKNIELNPKLKENIELIQNPLWNKSDIPMYYSDNGPGSIVSFNPIENFSGITHSITIDDLVDRKNVNKIDFIKMDIEGSELYALKGAVNTIKKFKPKLAVAIYHNLDDFVNIVHYVNDFGLGYKFYIGHFTIHYEETVLFCKAD